MAVFKTKRLILRHIKKEDAESIVSEVSDKTIHRNTLSMPYPYTLKDAKDWIGRNLKRYKDRDVKDYVLAIEIDGKFAGAVGIHKIVFGHKASLGYWLGRKYWGKGYMSEAVKLIMGVAFKRFKIKRLYACVFPWNKASMRVVEKCGMKFEGVLKKNVMKRGKIIDEYLWAKVK
jgi:[ribosomal protein S5]-alanine N-acetyltransferase